MKKSKFKSQYIKRQLQSKELQEAAKFEDTLLSILTFLGLYFSPNNQSKPVSYECTDTAGL